jgi:hypothetical protein
VRLEEEVIEANAVNEGDAERDRATPAGEEGEGGRPGGRAFGRLYSFSVEEKQCEKLLLRTRREHLLRDPRGECCCVLLCLRV